jgi:hypothetical protein
VVAALVLALLIGGFMQISRQSHAYDQSVNRSLAAQGRIVASESSATAARFRHLLATMQSLDRRTLQAELDAAVEQAGDQYSQAQRAAGSADSGSLAGQLVSVFSDRVHAVRDVRAAIDGLLGMHPLPVAGASVQDSQTASPTLLTSTQTTDQFAAAGFALARSDAVWRAVRAGARHSRGGYRLPSSAWITDPQTWQLGAVAEQVDLLAASPSLAAVHGLTLQTVRLTPPALPAAATTAPGVSVLTPTTSISVTVVVSNLGSVDEPNSTVQFALAPQTGGSAVTSTRHAAVPSGGSVTLDTVTFNVKPGSTYQLTVAIQLPAGEAANGTITATQTLQIAPGT